VIPYGRALVYNRVQLVLFIKSMTNDRNERTNEKHTNNNKHAPSQYLLGGRNYIRRKYNCSWYSVCAGVVRGYRVHYTAVSDLGEALEETKKVLDLVNSSRTDAVVGGLEPDRMYEFEIAAYTRRTEGERTRQRRVRTHGAGKAQIRGVVANLDLEER